MWRRWLATTVAVTGAVACTSSPKPLTAAEIRAVFAALHEADYPDEHFSDQQSAITPDGQGGRFTAVIGVQDPSADGKGMIVGFWHNSTFVGLAQDVMVLALNRVQADGPGRFTAFYVNYRDSDPLCCPSGVPTLLPIGYRWNGTRFVPSRPLPENLYRSGAEHVVVR